MVISWAGQGSLHWACQSPENKTHTPCCDVCVHMSESVCRYDRFSVKVYIYLLRLLMTWRRFFQFLAWAIILWTHCIVDCSQEMIMDLNHFNSSTSCFDVNVVPREESRPWGRAKCIILCKALWSYIEGILHHTKKQSSFFQCCGMRNITLLLYDACILFITWKPLHTSFKYIFDMFI